MRKQSTALALAAIFVAMTLPAIAQTQPQQQQTTTQQTTTTTTTTTANGPNGQYGDPVCGQWAGETWQPNGRCPGYVVGSHRARVAGTITIVRGHLVTVQQSNGSIVINDQPALNREQTGRVAVGRQIIAFGYWRDGNFYATVIQ